VELATPPCKTWICFETSTEASEEVDGLGGHGLKTGRSAIEEEEEEFLFGLYYGVSGEISLINCKKYTFLLLILSIQTSCHSLTFLNVGFQMQYYGLNGSVCPYLRRLGFRGSFGSVCGVLRETCGQMEAGWGWREEG
jgi:hypothetical protein